MSEYTTELRYICESITGNTSSQGYAKTNDIIEQARQKIFDFDYPIFDNDYKSVLETKILRHYYFREIGVETYGLWKFHLQNKMNEIMPYYNKMYNSELLEFNPLLNIDVTRTKKNTNDSNKNSSETSTSNNTHNSEIGVESGSKQDTNGSNKNTRTLDTTDTTTDNGTIKDVGKTSTTSNTDDVKLFQDTPQNAFTGLDDKYLTNRTKTSTINDSDTDNSNTNTIDKTTTDKQTGSITDDTTSKNSIENKSNSTTKQNDTNERTDSKTAEVISKTTDDYLEKITGKSNNTSYSSLIKEFRTTFLNIDMMIIDELDELFFQLW